jgi:hypothetical protein
MISISVRDISAAGAVGCEVLGDFKARIAIGAYTGFARHGRGDVKMPATRAGYSDEVFAGDSEVFATCGADSDFARHSEGDL